MAALTVVTRSHPFNAFCKLPRASTRWPEEEDMKLFGDGLTSARWRR